MIWDTGECFWCGVTRYVSCKHREGEPRPEVLQDRPKKVYISGGGSYRVWRRA